MLMIKETEKLTKSNQSVERMLLLLEALAGEPAPVRLNEFAKRMEMNQSTVLRFLTTLQRFGYVAQDQEGRYSMTMKICALSGLVSSHNELKGICAPYLRSLTQIFGESAILSIEQDMQVLYIDVVTASAQQVLTTVQRIGNLSPMHCTGSGKLFLCDYALNDIDRFIAIRGLERRTDHTITAREDLLSEIDIVRQHGYATDNEESVQGVRCIAAPVRDYTGRTAAAVSISGPSFRMTDALIYEKMPFLLDATHEISVRMGFGELGIGKKQTKK